jgi:medium-chain acyl-[acyl-carrier-protein] hydrolase
VLDRLWFYVPRPCPEARLRLYCFHHAGGGAATYRAWPELVGRDVEIAAVRLPGRENRFAEPRFRRMADVIAALHGPLRASLDRPFAFFGHSLGALVAFETARVLHRGGGPAPVHLFAAASPAPGHGGRGAPLYTLPAADLIGRLREYGGLPDAVLAQHTLLDVLLPVIRDDLELGYTYHATAGGRLRCPITVLGGTDDPMMSPDDLTRWRTAAEGPFQIHLVPGGHFFVTEAAASTTASVVSALEPGVTRHQKAPQSLLIECALSSLSKYEL